MLHKIAGKMSALLLLVVLMRVSLGHCGDLSLGLDVNICAAESLGSGVAKRIFYKRPQYNLNLTGRLTENISYIIGLGSTRMEATTCYIYTQNFTRKFVLHSVYTDLTKNVTTLVSNKLIVHGSAGLSYMYWGSIATGDNSNKYQRALNAARMKYKFDPAEYVLHRGVALRLGTGAVYKYTENLHFKATTTYSQFVTTQRLFKSIITYGIGIGYYL